jgi:acyl-CoA thioesterase
MSFLDLTTPTATSEPSEGRALFRVNVPDGWQQGAGAFGGWVMAVLVRSVEAVGRGRPLRSLSAEIPAPVMVGEAEIAVEVLRAGQSVSVVVARMSQKGALVAHAVAVFGTPRAKDLIGTRVELPRPSPPAWRTLDALPPDTPFFPTFVRHFEFRLVGDFPLSGKDPSGAQGWVRLRDPGPLKDAALVVAHVDAFWPAEFRRMTSFRSMVTAAFTLQMVGGAAAWTTDSPLFHTSRSLAASDGYIVEMRELWTEAGDLVALNEQTMVVVR